MKKRLLFMTEAGYFLPYVLFIAVLSLATITTIVIKYEREVEATYSLIEHIENETLIQMGRVQFKQEAPYKTNESGKVIYTFPNGTTEIEYDYLDATTYTVLFNNVTKNETELSTQTLLTVDEVSEEDD